MNNEPFQFILKIVFSSIFNTCHGASILCYTTTDSGIFLCETGMFWYCSWDFWSWICESPMFRQSVFSRYSVFARFWNY